MVQYPFTKQLCPALCKVKCGLVSEWVTRAYQLFFIKEVLNFGTAMIIQVFYGLSCNLAKVLHFSVLFAKKSCYISLGRRLRSSLQSKRPLFHSLPCKFPVHQTACFLGFYFFAGQNE